MKRFLILFIIASFSLACVAQSISDIQQDGAWYKLYDENGEIYKSVSTITYGDLQGLSSSIVVFKDGAFLYVYDSEMKKLYSGATSVYGEIVSVCGNTFTTKSGNWLNTYDKTGKKLNTRSK